MIEALATLRLNLAARRAERRDPRREAVDVRAAIGAIATPRISFRRARGEGR